MFLNSTPEQYTPRAFFVVDRSLIDNEVNYFDFQKSEEYQEVYKRVLSNPSLSMVIYNSPYFGRGNDDYRELDRVYEAYKVKIKAQDVYINPVEIEPLYNCPPEYPSYSDSMNSCIRLTDEGIKVGPKPTSPGINPVLILAAAAAAAFFIAG